MQSELQHQCFMIYFPTSTVRLKTMCELIFLALLSCLLSGFSRLLDSVVLVDAVESPKKNRAILVCITLSVIALCVLCPILYCLSKSSAPYCLPPTHSPSSSMHRAQWIDTNPGESMPECAIAVGYDQNNTQLYIGRAFYKGSLLPATVMPSNHSVSISSDAYMFEITTSYEVLCHGSVGWLRDSNGTVPSNAVSGGWTKDGETLYIGRAHHEGCLIPGKIHPAHKCLYIPFGDIELTMREYEVLVEIRLKEKNN